MSVVGLRWRAGGCHCGAVRFEAELAEEVEAQTCTCSMCSMVGFIHVIVPESRFRLLQGGDRLTTYAFNTGVAKHLFCSVCGVKAFYRPRSNPDGWSVNARCLDEEVRPVLRMSEFDGRNWEGHWAAHGHEVAELSKDGAA
jgi:hypothetical protein